MMGRTHLMLGFNSLWLFQIVMPSLFSHDSDTFALCLVTAGIGALLPDLDASNSLLQNLSVGGVRPLVLPARVLHASLGHRGALHSLLGLGVLGLLTSPLLPIHSPASFCLMLGFLSHLIGDACTKSGVPLFYPHRQSIHLLPRALRFSTGSLAEEAWFAALALGTFGLLLNHLVSVSLSMGNYATNDDVFPLLTLGKEIHAKTAFWNSVLGEPEAACS